MGARNALTGISFDNILPVKENASTLKKIAAGTVNWYYTNWKGMTFGFILSTLIMSLFSFVPIPNIKIKWLRAIVGAFIGAPLGVCANCATPITHGFKSSGGNDETALAITLSSPTLNIIALSILFNNFPRNLIALKLFSSLFIIVILVPIIVYFLRSKSIKETEEVNCLYPPPNTPHEMSKNFSLFCTSLFKSLWFIARTTLPLMLLAGLLGSFIFEFVNLDFLAGQHFSWFKLIIISGVGTLLPVPMTFDVIFSQKLMAAQTNISYVSALLCTLGIFSIYPFMMFWKNFSPKIAAAIFSSVWIAGILAGAYMHISDLGLLAKLPTSNYQKDPLKYITHAIDKNCKNRKDEESCIKKFIFLEVLETDKVELCQKIADQSTRQDCIFTHRVSKLGLDYEKCNTFEQPKECISKMITILSKHRFHERLPCEDKGYNSDSLCRDLNNLITTSRFIRDDRCPLIHNDDIRDKCYSLVTLTMVKFNRDFKKYRYHNFEKCSQIKDQEEKEMCYVRLAGFLGDSHWCRSENFKTEQNLNKCKFFAALRSDGIQMDENQCSKFPGNELQKQCLDEFNDFELQSNLRLLSSMGKINSFDTIDLENLPKENLANAELPKDIPPLLSKPFLNSEKFSVDVIAHQPRNKGDGQFTKSFGEAFGLNRPKTFIDDVEIFFRGYGVTSGDINNDHWQDFIIGSFQDINMYINTGGSFQKIPIMFKEKLYREHKINLSPINLALVDINNDGWPDLFVSNYDRNVFFIINDKHNFRDPDIIVLPLTKRGWGISATFGDFDGNGLLDLYLGNDHGGIQDSFLLISHTSFESNQNELYLNFKDGFQLKRLPDNRGATLSVLASDINNDGFLDLVQGNDFEVSDKFYFGNGKQLKEVLPDDYIIPEVSKATMSYDTADIDNDLKLETLSIDMTRGDFISTNYCSQFTGNEKVFCDKLFNIDDSIKNLNFNACNTFIDPLEKVNCYGAAIRFVALRFNDTKLCSLIPESMYVSRFICKNVLKENNYSSYDPGTDIKQVQKNVLLKQDKNGKFKNVADKYKITDSHWGWNSKFADLDNDGWQDVYASNGRFKISEISTNVFFHNMKGKVFKKDTQTFGLTDYADTSNYTYNDFDFDGDIDIISQGFMSPIRVFRNNEQKNKSITFLLNDFKGNRAGVGAKVIITYIENGVEKKQLRELKSGGGFGSYDTNVIHFGLADVNQVEAVEVKWITGEPTIIRKKMLAGQHYIITRK